MKPVIQMYRCDVHRLNALILIILNQEVMKKRFGFSLFVVLCVTLYSCSDTERKDGDWDDNIKLSAKAVEFTAAADSITITTGGSWWWVTDISVNGEYDFDLEGIDLESDHYTIKGSCYLVERRDKQTLFVKVDENPLDVDRVIRVGLEAGNYFDGVMITQKAK